MLKVLLVEDEYVIRKGIEAIFRNQTKLSLQVSAVGNAAEGIELARHGRFDVVVTDINMPDMSGLEMLRLLRKEGLCDRFVVITGYEKLEYAYQALQLHVSDYLLKPIDKEQLLYRLLEIDRELDRQARQVRVQLACALLYDQELGAFSADHSGLKRCFPHEKLCLVALLSREDAALASTDIMERLTDYLPVIVPFARDALSILALNFTDKLSPGDVSDILRCVGVDDGFYWGTSQVTDSFTAENLLKSRNEALTNVALRCLQASDDAAAWIRSHDVGGLATAPRQQDDLWNWCAREAERAVKAGYAKPWSVTELLVRVQLLSFWILHYGAEISTSFLKQPECEATDMESLVAQVRAFVSSAAFSSGQSVQTPNKIGRVLAFIHANFQQDLSLSQAAALVNLQPTYLSHLFKQATGQNFLHYLHQTRIDTAVDLLRTQPELSLEVVAKQVGYQSITNFYRVFRSYMGQSPREWLKDEKS